MRWNDHLRKRVEAAHVIEREGWRVERARRVTERLQARLAEHERFETLVIHAAHANAFTGPGTSIYISHRLLDQLPDEAAAAFVIAHELAHHHLGHIPGPYARAASLLAEPIAPHEKERHADLHALELCLTAGYEAERCILALQILDAIYLDCGDLEASLGVPHDREGDVARRGYFPSQERIAHVRAHVAEFRKGTRIINVLAAEQDAIARRRMKQAFAAVGSIAAAAALLLIRRR
jgi:hypothetical protein